MIPEGEPHIYCYQISGIDQPFVALARSPEEADQVLGLPDRLEQYRHLDITVTGCVVAPMIIHRPDIDPLTGRLGRCPLRKACPEHGLVHAEQVGHLERIATAVRDLTERAQQGGAPGSTDALWRALGLEPPAAGGRTVLTRDTIDTAPALVEGRIDGDGPNQAVSLMVRGAEVLLDPDVALALGAKLIEMSALVRETHALASDPEAQ